MNLIKGIYIIATLMLVCLCSSCNKELEDNIVVTGEFVKIQRYVNYFAPLSIHLSQNQTYLNDKLARQEDTLNTKGVITYFAGDTVDISNEPVTYTVSYFNMLEAPNLLVNGELRVTVYNYANKNDGSLSITFNNYSINGNSISGSLKIDKKGNGNYILSTSGFSVIFGKNKIDYDSSIEFNIDTGIYPDIIGDNLNTQSEQGSIISSEGRTYSFSSENNIFSYSCKEFSIGITEFLNEENARMILNYGDGTCDNSAEVSIEDRVYKIGLE